MAQRTPQTPIGPIDGLRRSPGRPASRATALPVHHKPLAERPLPSGLSSSRGHALKLGATPTNHHLSSSDLVSHPSLPSPQSRPTTRSNPKTSVWRSVIGRSYRVAHDKRSTTAILIATLLSPLYWMAVATPWIVLDALRSQSSQWNFIQTTSHRLISQSFAGISFRLLLLGLGLFLIWVGRHAFLLVSHAVHVRQIDHRLSDTHAFWWSAIHKLSRSFTLAVFDFLLVVTLLSGIGGAIAVLLSRHSSANLFYEGLAINGLLILAVLATTIIAVHRPLVRVMLATTSQTAWRLIKYSFGMIVFNFGRTILMGAWWLISLVLTTALLGAVGWATLSYSLGAGSQGLLKQILLVGVTTILMYIVAAAFLVWSQGYWSLAYHYLAHRTYPAQVSRFFTTEPHLSRKRNSLLRVAIICLILVSVATAGIILARQPLSRAWERVQSAEPTILNWLG